MYALVSSATGITHPKTVPTSHSLFLSGPISHKCCVTIAAIPHNIARYLSGRLGAPENGAIPPPWYFVSHRHICARPPFATYRATIVRSPPSPTITSTKQFCDTIATSIARYKKHRCWASKVLSLHRRSDEDACERQQHERTRRWRWA